MPATFPDRRLPNIQGKPLMARPLQILINSSDRALLRHASRLLSVFGYQVGSFASRSQAESMIRTGRPDVLLVDGTADRDGALGLCRLAGETPRNGYIYKALMLKEVKPAEIPPCLEAGVDDFLSMPLEHGELLARLRTAARVLEFERRIGRLRRVGAHDMGRDAFLARLEVELRHALTTQKPISCVVVAADHQDGRRAAHTEDTSQVLAQAARTLNEHPDRVRGAAWLSDERFGAIVGGNADEAAKLIESARQTGPSNAQASEPMATTLSFGLSDSGRGAITAHELLKQAETALVQAQASGGDFVVCFGQFADEDRSWEQLAKTGALFEKSLARDIMVPCPICLHQKHTLASAAAAFEHTQLQALPVVDDEGKLAGLLTHSGIQLRLAGENVADDAIASFMTRDVASFDERTTLSALIDYFSQESPLAIAIVNKGRPTGLVTPSSLATLSERLTTETFAPTEAKPGRAGLIVPNLCGMDA
jgi:PleD family two-component response regulator